jgi:acyl-homoserine lactone acylase PvdQ
MPEFVPRNLSEQPQPDGRRPLHVYAARPVQVTTGSGGQPRSGGETLVLGGFRRLSTVGLATGALLAFSAATASAAPTPGAYKQNDFGGFRNILPPAQGANANSNQIAAFEANGNYPPHTSDQQLSMYSNLLYATPGLQASQIPNFYKDASFGVMPAHVARTYSPRSDVTIERDQFGVPHIYGATREGTMFGAGYAVAEDRLFMIDALRHAARAQLSSFAGGANAAMDESIWADTPYNESELQRQYDRADELYGQDGVQIQTDVNNYVAGVNKFISEACTDPLKLPGEYNLIDPSQSICLPGHQWKVTDVIAIASLVAGIFGKGGGGELGAAQALVAAQQRFGASTGRKVWADFQSFNDPEAPTTVQGKSFPYGQPPAQAAGVALPDPGTVQPANVVQSASASAKASAAPPPGGKHPAGILKPFQQRHDASNALLVSARKSASGHPVAVMGPQVGYWSPEILMEEDIHAPATAQGPPIDARGAAFPGTNLYVQLGRGRDYSWSATSAGQDITDTYAVKLCEPSGGQATIASDHYLFKGQCLPFDVLTRTNSWSPTPADQTPAGSETLTTLRTKLGIVIARAKIQGQPYAYTKLRDTYFHEVDPSALGFADFNNPNKMRTPQDFMQAANHISYTFNWFYADNKHIAYFNSGANPVRPSNVDPNLPTFGRDPFLWQGYNPNTATEDLEPLAAHPHVVDQTFLTSWNNRQAPDYNTGYSPLFRSQLLDERIKPDIAGSKKVNLQQLISDMEDAGTVDLRGDLVLPWILKVIHTQPVTNPARRAAVQQLAAWVAAGAHRIDRNKDGVYEQTQAIRIMDAWWPRLVEAEFKPTLGQALFDRTSFGHDAPGRIGSAFDTNSYGYVQKDLRDLLGASVQGHYSRVYCGQGQVGACRTALLNSLSDALQHDSNAAIYGGQTQAAHDKIGFSAVGAITQPLIPWVNRPTFQQAVEVQGHR